MQLFINQVILLGKRLLIALILFFAGRLFFFLYNSGYFAPAWPGEVLKSFFYGIQFDISALVYFNLPFIIFHLWPAGFTNKKIYQSLLKLYFISINGMLLLSNLIDAEYFRYTGKRTTSDIFSYMALSSDIFNLVPRFIYDYWFILLLWFIILFILTRAYPGSVALNSRITCPGSRRIAVHTALLIITTAFLISLARGYRLKPLRVITASNYVSAENIPLILNTPFTIMKSFNKQHLSVPEYFPAGEAEKYFSPVRIAGTGGDPERLNVIIIIMESFSKEFSGFLTGSGGYIPFTDSLMQKAIYFPNAFANGKKSLEALPAILASIPALTETPFVSSPYSANRFHSLPSELKKQGYHTSFFHGGINGTMGFDDFTKLAEIDHYYGRNEFGNDKYFDGYWGIYDEHFFRYFADKLSTFPQPFFSSFFSLSSHHPYVIPDEFEARFPGELPVHRSIGYADYSLKKFFEIVSVQPWFENTLFVITADHTYQSTHPFYRNRIGDYAVPIFYYHPANPDMGKKNTRLTQHIDIVPSVLDYLNIESTIISFGNSVFSDDDQGYVVNYLNHLYHYMEDEWIILHDGQEMRGLFNFRNDSLLQNNYTGRLPAGSPEVPAYKLENRLKSIIQQFNYRMVNNRLLID